MTWCLCFYWTFHHVLFSHKTWRGICPKDLNFVHQLCLTKKCDISFFLFSFSVMYFWRELGFVCPLVRIACSTSTFLSMSFLNRCLRTLVVVSIMVSCSGNFAILTMFYKILFIFVFTYQCTLKPLLIISWVYFVCHTIKIDGISWFAKIIRISVTIFFIRGNEIYFQVVS